MEVPTSALAIGAHPDDVELTCGATLASWVDQGAVVNHLILTDGSKGTWDPDADQRALIQQRADEQRAAATALGATGEIVFLGEVDGELEARLELRAEVAAVIRRLKPEVVLGHDPWKRYRLHPDHRSAGYLTVDGCVAARDPLFVPARGAAHRPRKLLLFEADEPNLVVDVTGHVGTKVVAALEHRSQWLTTMAIPDEGGDEGIDRFRQRTEDEARRVGEPAGMAFGEEFRVLEL